MRILLRVCYDMRRQRDPRDAVRHGAVLAADVDGSGVWWEPSAGQMLAGAGVRRDPDRDEALDVRDAIASLSADDRLVLVLFYVNDFPVRQISQIMNVSGRCRAHPSCRGRGTGSRLPIRKARTRKLRWRDEP